MEYKQGPVMKSDRLITYLRALRKFAYQMFRRPRVLYSQFGRTAKSGVFEF